MKSPLPNLAPAVLILLLTAFGPHAAEAAPGDLDTSFGGTGKVVTDFSGREDFGNAVAVQADGKIVVVGFTRNGGTGSSSTEDFALTRYNPDGSLDPNFGSGGRVQTDFGADDRAKAVAIRADGKIIVVGSNSNVVIVAAYNPDGTRDTTLGASLGPCSGQCSLNAVAIQSDQKIVAAGRAQGSVAGTSDFFLIRFNAAGNNFDSSFNGSGVVQTDFSSRSDTIAGLVIQSDGKIVAGGTTTTDASGSTSMALARYNTNGTLDSGFGTGGKVTTAFTGQFHGIRAIALQSDGKVVAAGFTFQTESNFALARYNTNGMLDGTFGSGGKVTTDFSPGAVDEAHAVVVQSDGRIIAGGIGTVSGNALEFALVRYASDGMPDSTFGTSGKVTTNFSTSDDVINAMALQADGKAIAVGLANSNPDIAVARYLTAAAGESPQSLNIATRMRVETGSNVLIAGFIVTGNATKNVAVRGIGPSLTQFGIADALADPTLELRSSSSLLMQNDNWQDDSSQASQLTAAGLGLSNPNESGVVASLSPAGYTAILAGKNQGTGVGLVEVYDINQTADSQLANISTRGLVGTENNVMIGGFILGGHSGSARIVIRGIGPTLAQFGLSPVLANPVLELHDGNGALLISNDNWQDNSTSAAQLTAAGLAPQNSLESGIFATLAPGAFTAILAGKDGGTGIGLVEIYNLR